jgi:hypothetical protein
MSLFKHTRRVAPARKPSSIVKHNRAVAAAPAPVLEAIAEPASDWNIPVAKTNNNTAAPEDPSILAGNGFNLPNLFFRAMRQVTPLEEIFTFTSTAAMQIMAASNVIRSRRFCRQVWFYGISAFTGVPGIPEANQNVAYWGWSAESLANQVPTYAGVYGSLIAPADGHIVDLWAVWIAGSVNDSLFISVL